MEIRTEDQFNHILAQGAYAWPGGYPLYFIMADNEPLSFHVAVESAELIRAEFRENTHGDWRVAYVEINYDDAQLYCAHSGERIESAYAEPEADQPESSAPAGASVVTLFLACLMLGGCVTADRPAPELRADRLALIGVDSSGFREWVIRADMPAGECVRELRARYAAGLDGACVHASRLAGYVNGD